MTVMTDGLKDLPARHCAQFLRGHRAGPNGAPDERRAVELCAEATCDCRCR
jgi:hypothetical protein